MSDKISYLKAEYKQQAEVIDRADRNERKGGGEPPGGNELESRVVALEKTSQDIREKLVRVETKLEGIESSMATKAEIAAVGTMIAELKTSVAESMILQTRWLIGACIALAGLAFTAAKYLH
ncbi:hypothetical protein [Pseudomonas sp. MF6747]|uniref:hypothetical protein n=1 Tax=Pseudomonas sp. MF6747 TaxID=2797527 RepID=UPI00190A5748|nr:hypothetical protein [Pseudomonas sp. MF6747]MBK3510747.1 hypothetical protein [Pseudomonas sp. MF6747]